MAYTAIKPCRLAGQSFKIGDIVPAGNIQPGAAKNLVKMGIIAEQGSEEANPSTITIKIQTAEGELPLEVTPEGVQAVFDALNAKASDAEATVAEMTDEEALILLNASDKRKSIQEATEQRAAALSEQ